MGLKLLLYSGKTNNILENKRRLTKSTYFRKCITGCWGVWALLDTRSAKDNLRWRGISVPNDLFVTVYWLLFGFLYYSCIYIFFLLSLPSSYALHCRGRSVRTSLSLLFYALHCRGRSVRTSLSLLFYALRRYRGGTGCHVDNWLKIMLLCLCSVCIYI